MTQNNKGKSLYKKAKKVIPGFSFDWLVKQSLVVELREMDFLAFELDEVSDLSSMN